MHRSRALPVFLLALLIGAAGLACSPKIGDSCSSSINCSTTGDRLCDTTQPGGYCTIFNCEPGTCPSEARCVAFDQQVAPECSDPQSWARFERAFCMRGCSSDSDCRGGYICFDLAPQPNPWGASVIDHGPDGTKICISPSSGSPAPEGLGEVCSPYDGGFSDVIVSSPDADTNDATEEAAALDASVDGSDDASIDAPADGGADGAEDASNEDAADASDGE